MVPYLDPLSLFILNLSGEIIEDGLSPIYTMLVKYRSRCSLIVDLQGLVFAVITISAEIFMTSPEIVGRLLATPGKKNISRAFYQNGKPSYSRSENI